MPSCSKANHLPVRPSPACTSSSISSTWCSVHQARSSAKNPGGGRRTPASPWIGSISTAQVSSLAAAFRLAMSPKSKAWNPPQNGPKPSRYSSSLEKPMMVLVRPWKLPRATRMRWRPSGMPLTRWPQRRAHLIAVSTASAPVFIGSARSKPVTCESFSRKGPSVVP